MSEAAVDLGLYPTKGDTLTDPDPDTDSMSHDPWDVVQQLVSDEGFPPFNSWVSKAEWLALAWAGEVGEACNEIKKIRRDDGGLLSVERSQKLNAELVDSAVYLLVLLDHLGVPMSSLRDRIVEAHERFLARPKPVAETEES